MRCALLSHAHVVASAILVFHVTNKVPNSFSSSGPQVNVYSYSYSNRIPGVTSTTVRSNVMLTTTSWDTKKFRSRNKQHDFGVEYLVY